MKVDRNRIDRIARVLISYGSPMLAERRAEEIERILCARGSAQRKREAILEILGRIDVDGQVPEETRDAAVLAVVRAWGERGWEK